VRYAITAESGDDRNRILKIGQHLPKLWAKIKVCVFFWTQFICQNMRTKPSNLFKFSIFL